MGTKTSERTIRKIFVSRERKRDFMVMCSSLSLNQISLLNKIILILIMYMSESDDLNIYFKGKIW